MPFVTETTKVYLILPIYSDEQSHAIHFLHYLNKTILDKETREKLEVFLVHIVSNKQEYSQTQKWFETLRHTVDNLRHVRSQLMVTYQTIQLPLTPIPRYTHSTYILDFFSSKLRSNSLIFLTNPYVNIEADFLNRCRLNVIENVQIFFPIAFHQYHPHIIARTHHFIDNSTIELHKSHGWFNSFVFDQISLYISDYLQLKKTVLTHNTSLSSRNLHDLFVQFTDLHILRAPDHALREHYRPIKCEPMKSSNLVEYHRCLNQQERGIASRGQLAMMMIENESLNRTRK